MSWAIGFDPRWERDIGYGVPAICDHPDCNEQIDRGLSYVCGGEAYGGERGCGLYFCSKHMTFDAEQQLCERCLHNVQLPPSAASLELPLFAPKPDTEEWITHKLTDESWAEWRSAYPDEVANLRAHITQENS